MYYIVKNWFSFVGENYKFTSPKGATKFESLIEARKVAVIVENLNQMFLSCIIAINSDDELCLLEVEYNNMIHKIKYKKSLPC
jgi:hypothetical protein